LKEEENRHKHIFDKVIPMLTAYRTMIHMKNIKEGRKKLFIKELEKFEEQGHPYAIAKQMAAGTWKEPEEEKEEEEPEVSPTKKSPGKQLFGYAAEKAKEEEEKKKKEAEE